MKTQFPNDFAETTTDVFYIKKSGHLFGWDRDCNPTFEVYADPDELSQWMNTELQAGLLDTEVPGAKEVRVNLPTVELLRIIHRRWR